MTSPDRLKRVKQWARQIKRDVVALWFAARDPRTPLSAKFVAGAVAAYALSPVDLIPDFIPVLATLMIWSSFRSASCWRCVSCRRR